MFYKFLRLKQDAMGAAQVEELVLIAGIAIPVIAGLAILGRLLLAYHETIEKVLFLPIP